MKLFFLTLAVALVPLTLPGSPLQISGTLGTDVDRIYHEGGGILVNSLPIGVPQTLSFDGVSGSILLTIHAAPGTRIQVTPHGLDDTTFNIYGSYRGAEVVPGVSLAGPASFTFTGLTGSAPVFSDFSDLDAGLFVANIRSEVSAAFSFTSLEVVFPLNGVGNAFTLTESLSDPLTIGAWVADYAGPLPPGAFVAMDVVAVPEPAATAVVIGTAIARMAWLRRKKRH